MKPHRLLPLLVLVLSAFMLSCDSGQQTVTAPDDLQPQFAKPPKDCTGEYPHPSCKPPDDPGDEPGELIIFTGDFLTGSQWVEDCCPNAGPAPEYTLTFSGEFPDEDGKRIKGTHAGHIFMNNWRPRGTKDGDYIVQFCWWGEGEEPIHYFIEIKGGVAQGNKRTKDLTVTFIEENIVEWKIWEGILDDQGTVVEHRGTDLEIDLTMGLNFTLQRLPNGLPNG